MTNESEERRMEDDINKIRKKDDINKKNKNKKSGTRYQPNKTMIERISKVKS